MARTHPVIGLLVLVMVVVAGCTGPASPDAATSTSGPTTTAHEGLPLGTVEETGDTDRACETDCEGFTVQCPGLDPIRGTLQYHRPDGDPTAMVVMFSGGLGSSWWNESSPLGRSLIDRLVENGFESIEVRWITGWPSAPRGVKAGVAATGCRPATILHWLHARRWLPLGIDAEPAVCGFSATGNSGGSSQIAYSLAYFGLDIILDVAVLSSGPPHGDIARGCSGDPADREYSHPLGRASVFDRPYGFAKDDQGPCAARDASWADTWRADSVAIGGLDYLHPGTRLHILLGADDHSAAVPQALLYGDRLGDEGTPILTIDIVPAMPHPITKSSTGLDALFDALADGRPR